MPVGRLGIGTALVVALSVLTCPMPAQAAAGYVQPGFAWPADPKATILVAYPDVKVHRQGKGGVEELDAEWTRLAQANLAAELQASGLPKVATLRFMSSEQASGSEDYAALLASYRQRIGEIIFKVPQGSPDVTKAKKCKCTYNLADVKDRVSQAFGPADFVLMINQYDTYASSGQIFGEILGATIGGATAPQGSAVPMRRMRPHFGNAILFDLRTGDVIWMHGDGAFGGDLRKPDTAKIRVRQALSKFPGLGK